MMETIIFKTLALFKVRNKKTSP